MRREGGGAKSFKRVLKGGQKKFLGMLRRGHVFNGGGEKCWIFDILESLG